MNALFTGHLEDEDVAVLFRAPAWVQRMTELEAALARAHARSGVVPTGAAEEIARKTATFAPDLGRLEAATAKDGFPVVGLLEQLRAHCGGEAARWLHWGATTQDIVDTTLVLQLRAALERIEARLTRLADALARLADAERHTVMVGRTHLQPALPVTFGAKAAHWLAPLVRHQVRLRELRPRLLTVQMGGAAGTLAALDKRGRDVARALADELGLAAPSAAWGAQRDVIGELAAWLLGVAASVAKFAQDILLLAQAEVGEVHESRGGGGSSAMPQKSNPVRSEAVLLAARTVATHHAGLAALPPAEHERGTLSGQAELVHVPAMAVFTGGAIRAAEDLVRGLVLDRDRMRENLHATHGMLLAEAVTLALARRMDRAAAQAIVREACAAARTQRRHLLEIVRDRPELRDATNELPEGEAGYLGATQALIDAVLAEHAALGGRVSS